MNTIGVSQYIYNGILVETLSPAFGAINLNLYKTVVVAGGAMAVHLPEANFELEGLKYNNQEIMIATEIMDCLTQDEVNAILAHEAAHIINGDLTNKKDLRAGKMRRINNLENEKAADLAGVQAAGAKAMRDAIMKMSYLSVKKLTGLKKPWLIGAISYLCMGSVGRKRLRILKEMITQGL